MHTPRPTRRTPSSRRWLLAVGLAVAPALLVPGCTKKKKQAPATKPATDQPVKPSTPGAMTPGSRAAAVPRLGGADAPAPDLVKAFGETPQLMLRAQLSSFTTSPLTRPLVGLVKKALSKELKGCAKLIDLTQLKRALYVQSTGQLIRRARDVPKDSHYAVVETGFDVPALFACLAKAGRFKQVTLNGAPAFQPPAKKVERAERAVPTKQAPAATDKHAQVAPMKQAARPTSKTSVVKKDEAHLRRPSWWFAAGKHRFVIVDGPWARKVTPGKGPLGTGALLEHVGQASLRLWAVKFAPDIPAVTAYIQLGDPFVARADITWRDEKDAKAMPGLVQRFAQFKPELATVLKPLHITVKGKVSTFTVRANKAEAEALSKVAQLLFSPRRSRFPARAYDKAPRPTTQAAPPMAPAPTAQRPTVAPSTPRAKIAAPAPRPKASKYRPRPQRNAPCPFPASRREHCRARSAHRRMRRPAMTVAMRASTSTPMEMRNMGLVGRRAEPPTMARTTTAGTRPRVLPTM